MDALSEESILEKIRSWGVPLEKMFLVGSEDALLIGLWLDDIGFRFYLIENDDVATRCLNALKRLCARRCESPADVYEIARIENWPGYGR